MQLERRRKRSNFKGLSLHYWFSSLANQTEPLAYVLADMSGLLIASSIRGVEAEELAAMAPLFVREQGVGACLEWHRLPLHIDPIEIDGCPLLLCAVGAESSGRAPLQQAARGVERILNN